MKNALNNLAALPTYAQITLALFVLLALISFTTLAYKAGAKNGYARGYNDAEYAVSNLASGIITDLRTANANLRGFNSLPKEHLR